MPEWALRALSDTAGRFVLPSRASYHYNHNAETYMHVANALRWAMAEMLQQLD